MVAVPKEKRAFRDTRDNVIHAVEEILSTPLDPDTMSEVVGRWLDDVFNVSPQGGGELADFGELLHESKGPDFDFACYVILQQKLIIKRLEKELAEAKKGRD